MFYISPSSAIILLFSLKEHWPKCTVYMKCVNIPAFQNIFVLFEEMGNDPYIDTGQKDRCMV
jgi:hypothetical protein